VLYVVIAVIVFVLSGVLAMAGLGAAFLFVPIFYWLGIPLGVASSTALLLNVVSLGFASAVYWRAHLVNLRFGIPITIAAVALAPLGASAAPHVSTRILLAILAAFLVFAGSMMLFYRPRAGVRSRGRPTEVAIGSGVGGVAGFLGGLLGVGGGNVILPALSGAGLEAKVVAGTTGFAVVFSSLSGFLGRISMGGVNGLLLGVSVTATAAGSLVGSRLMTSRLSSLQLKRLIAVVLWAVAVKIIWGLV
jgi:hypothetical protein